MQKQKTQQASLQATAGENPDGSIGEAKALAPGTHDGHDFKPKPKGTGKGGPAPKTDGRKPSPKRDAAPSSSSGSGGAPGAGPTATKATTATGTQTDTPQQVDLTIDDDMDVAADEMGKVLEEHERKRKTRKDKLQSKLQPILGRARQRQTSRTLADSRS